MVFIDKLTHSDGTSCYVVVFASPVHAEQVLKLKDIAVDLGHSITVQTPQEMESIWDTVGDMLNSAGSAPILQLAQEGLSSALNGLGFNWSSYLTN